MGYVSPPFVIKVELTEGCNLYCSWCGIKGIRKKPGGYKFLSKNLALKISKMIQETGWSPRIELTMRGEPTMNPNINEIILILKEKNKNSPIMVTSNGGGLIKGDITKNILSLFDNGLSILCLDNYEYSNIVSKIVKSYSGDIPIYNYPLETPYKKNKNEKKIIIFPDISKEKTGTRSLSNHCGCAFPLDYSKHLSLCARPFRELVIRYDGLVPICCNDWLGRFIISDINKENILKIWEENKNLDAVRRELFFNKRTFPPCYGCNSISYRVGLLPDKLGKLKKNILPPDNKVKKIIKSLSTSGTVNKPFPLPWDNKKNIDLFLNR